MRLLGIVSWLGLALLCGTGSAAAGEIADLAAKAESQLQAGQGAAAIETLRTAMLAANNKTPLAFRKAIFVSEPPRGFGIYKERPNKVFAQNEPLVAYVEPVGIGWAKQGDGTLHSSLAVDFEIRNPKGDILAGKRDFGQFEFTSHEQNMEVMTHVTLNLTGASPGQYIFGLIYRDKITGKSANVDLPFEIK